MKKTKKPFKTLKEVSDFGGKLRNTFYLRGWTINFSRHEGQTDSVAECTPEEQYRRAELRFYPKFWQQPYDDQVEIIVHEMCHIITGVQNNLICALHDGQHVSVHQRREAFERETSWMSDIIVPFVKDL